jgi:hypothetical protein
VINDELAVAFEQGFEVLFALPAFEHVVLFDLHHRVCAAPL